MASSRLRRWTADIPRAGLFSCSPAVALSRIPNPNKLRNPMMVHAFANDRIAGIRLVWSRNPEEKTKK